MTAHAEYHEWESAPAFKLLTDNRDLYLLQSERTRNGVVAPFPRGGLPANNSNSNQVRQVALSNSKVKS